MTIQEVSKTGGDSLGVEKPVKTLLGEIDQMRTSIIGMKNWMWETLIKDDTWNLRQYAGYGMAKKGEEDIMQKALEEVNFRLYYVQEAYHFPDAMTALAGMCDLKGGYERNPQDSNWKDRIKREVDYTRKSMLTLRTDLDEFLGGIANEAFVLTINEEKTGYTVTDLPVNKEELRQKWDTLLLSIGITPHQLATRPKPSNLSSQRSE